MKIAAIYDIHGNLPALEAVLEQITQHDVDHIVVGGDVVAGPLPVGCLDRLKAESERIPMTFIHGNAESETLRVAAGQPAAGLSPVADQTARWVLSQLRPDQVEWLKTWVLSAQLERDDGRTALFCHASPRNDIDVFTRDSAEARIAALLTDVSADLIVCGHTHMQFERRVGRYHIVNAGSVGMPFGRTGAHWLRLDGSVQLQRTLYDFETAAERIRQSNYPDAAQFSTGNILSVPAEAAALAMLTQLESKQIA